jgi:hypothetical protein
MPCKTGSDRFQLELKNTAALFATSDDISGSGIIIRVCLSRVQVDFIIQSGLQPVSTSELASTKEQRFVASSPEAFSIQIIGNLAALAISALDP